MSGPLSGTRVVDWSTSSAGAITTMVLSDYGADVIRIEPPGGAPSHQQAAYQAWDRGKRSVELDVSTATGRDTLDRLLETADVFVEDDSEAIEAAGLAETHDRFPALIHLALTSDGDEGPSRPLDDSLVAARLGVCAGAAPGADGAVGAAGVHHVGWLLPAYSTASVAILGVVSALYARGDTGPGQLVEVSTRDGVLPAGGMGRWWQESTADVPAPTGANRFRGLRLLLMMYECADGNFLQFHTGAPGRFWRMVQLLGLDDRISPSKSLLEMGETLTEEEARVIEVEVPNIMRTRTRDEWLKLFLDADICCEPVLRPEEAFDDEQVRHNGLISQVDDPEVGQISMVGPPVSMTDSSPSVAGPRRRLGADTAAVLAEAHATRPTPFGGGPTPLSPLEGVRIIDFGQYIAGPLAGRLLADLGADVIKVEPVVGDTMRPHASMWEFGNRGKRSIALDLKSPEAREIIYRLIPQTDVVGHNMRPGAAEKLGIDYATLRQLNPRLIYCGSPGFGSSGPKMMHQSFAPITGGTNGLWYDAAGAGAHVPRRAGNEDYFNAALGACTISMALVHRRRTGRGQYLESPQLNSAMFLMSHTTVGEDGKFKSRLQLDSSQLRYSALDGLYATSDSYLAVAVTSTPQFESLVTALGLPDVAADPRYATAGARLEHDADLAALLAAVLAKKPVRQWVAQLSAAGVPCEQVAMTHFQDGLWTSEEALASGRVVEFVHPVYGRIREIGQLIRFSKTPGVLRGRGPLLGEHTVEVLSELGYDHAEIADLQSRRIAVTTGQA